MFKNRSKVMFVSGVLGTLYLIYIANHFFGGVASTTGAEQTGAAIATALVLPHIALLVLAVIFNWVGFFMNKGWAAITCGVLYSVSGVVFILYIIFEIPMIVLSFVGIGRIKAIRNRKMQRNSSEQNAIDIETAYNTNIEVEQIEKSPLYKRKWFIATLSVLGVIILLGIIGSMLPESDTKQVHQTNEANQFTSDTQTDTTNESPTESTTEQIVTAKPIDTTVDEMYDELEKNALKASKTYTDQRVRVTGMLSNIDASGDYFNISPLHDTFSFSSIQCNLNSQSTNDILELSDDQVVTVTGVVTDVGEIFGYSMDAESVVMAERVVQTQIEAVTTGAEPITAQQEVNNEETNDIDDFIMYMLGLNFGQMLENHGYNYEQYNYNSSNFYAYIVEGEGTFYAFGYASPFPAMEEYATSLELMIPSNMSYHGVTMSSTPQEVVAILGQPSSMGYNYADGGYEVYYDYTSYGLTFMFADEFSDSPSLVIYRK